MSTSRLLSRFLLSLAGLAAVLGVVYYYYLMPQGVTLLSAAEEAPGAVVVVEHFTSEGCANCRVADDLLWQIETESRDLFHPIYCLSYQVDSRDQLGGAEAAIPKRQQAYAQRLGVTTKDPLGMIVNGTEHIAGSHQAEAVQSISKSLHRVAPVQLELQVSAIERDVTVKCLARFAPEGAILCVACVDSLVISNPTEGANQGRVLKSVNVVRDFRSVPLDAQFDGSVKLRRSENRDGQVIAFVQEPGPGRILGATSAPLRGE